MQFNSYKSFILFLLLFTVLTIPKKIYGQTNDGNNIEQQRIESVFQKIELDFSEGTITLDESVLYLVYSIFEPSMLPDKYLSLSRNGEPTWVFTKILKTWHSLNSTTKNELMKYGFSISGTLSRPTFLNSTKESAHFKVFYSVVAGDSNAVSTIDENTNGTPDYVESVLTVMEHVRTNEIGTMGFTAPPGDSTTGGNSKYDIYLFKLAPNLFGFAAPDSLVGNNPNSTAAEKNAYASYIALRNEYSQFTNHSQLENIQVTAAHEFFHSIQFGYDTFEKSWLKEATAAWMEDEVYDDINDNIQYLPNWFKIYFVPLDATAAESLNHWYGSWIYFRYLSEHLGGQSTIKKILEKSITHDSKIKDFSFIAIDEALKTKNSSFKESFKNFSLSNLYKTIAPYNYEEAELYPSVTITKKIFQSHQYISYESIKHTNYYFRIFPNVIPGTPDEIEFTLTPVHASVKIALVVTAKTSGSIDVASPSISEGKFKYTLQSSSSKDEIYAIIVNTDTLSTDFTLDVIYKGNLVKLNNIGTYSYERLSDNYFIDSQFRETTNSEGYPRTDIIITRYELKYGDSREIFRGGVIGASSSGVYLAKTGGDVFISAYDLNKHQSIKYGYHLGQLKQLAGVFDIRWVTAVDYNKIFFYGNLRNPDFSYSSGIFASDLKAGPPQMILDLTNTDFIIDIIESDRNSFAALKYNLYEANSDELISYTNNSLNTFYLPVTGNRIRSLVFDDNLAAWSETDNSYSNGVIKAFDFSTNTLKTIRAVNGVDAYSVATNSKRVVWWENTGSGAKIKLWVNDSTTTLRTTFKGLYLDDSGVSSISFDVPIDTGGVAWMETDFMLYYYSFSSSSLNSYDLSSYFSDNLNTGYLVKLSGKNIIIEALSSVPSEKLGTYLFKLGDIVTGVKEDNSSLIPIKFSLSQNYPNPFNPTTIIEFSIPVVETRYALSVQLIIYDILGRKIKTLVDEKRPAGNYKITFNAGSAGGGLPSGVYFYRLTTSSGFVQTKKMLLLK